MEMREHAEALASQGFRVLPLHYPYWNDGVAFSQVPDGYPVKCSCGKPDCSSIGKHPLNHDGSKGASSDLAQIAQWWSDSPTANIGIATGYGDSVDVIDIDGPAGQAVLNDYVKRYGTVWSVGIARTGRVEGWHMYVAPGGQQNWTGGFGGHPKGLDVKGRGGYVVAPPSLHASGNRYEWVNEPHLNAPLGAVEWPDWHALVVDSLSPEVPRSDELRIVQPWGGHSPSGRSFVDAVCERVRRDVESAGEGSRWQTLAMVGVWDMAGLIQSGQITEHEALAVLEDLGREIGLDGGELARLPRELGRALSKRVTPIAPRATHSAPTPAPGVFTLPDARAEAVADLGGAGTLFEDIEIDRRAGLYRIEFLARRKAQDDIRRSELGEMPEVDPLTLDDLLAQPTEETAYRIKDLWPVGGRALLAAQYKAGKTTMVGNVVRSLADNARFLSRYQATQPEGTIALLDTEMSPNMLRGWLRDQAISHTEKVWVAPLRGMCATFEITDELVRAQWVQRIKERNTEIVILDCLGPVLAAIGLDESKNTEVGKFISAFDAMLTEAGVSEALVIHHMGHTGERSRGSSRLRDWPDVEWHLIREGQEEDKGTPAPDAPRYFRAFGRDVSVPEQLMSYEPEFRWLSVSGEHSDRKVVKASRAKTDLRARVLSAVRAEQGISTRNVCAMVRGRTDNVLEALRLAIEDGAVMAVNGPNRVVRHYTPDYEADKCVPSVSESPETPETLIDLG